MGGNGSSRSRSTHYFYGRRWKTVDVLSNGVKVIEFKDPKTPGKMPEESRSPNSIYAMMKKMAKALKALLYMERIAKRLLKSTQRITKASVNTTIPG